MILAGGLQIKVIFYFWACRTFFDKFSLKSSYFWFGWAESIGDRSFHRFECD